MWIRFVVVLVEKKNRLIKRSAHECYLYSRRPKTVGTAVEDATTVETPPPPPHDARRNRKIETDVEWGRDRERVNAREDLAAAAYVPSIGSIVVRRQFTSSKFRPESWTCDRLRNKSCVRVSKITYINTAVVSRALTDPSSTIGFFVCEGWGRRNRRRRCRFRVLLTGEKKFLDPANRSRPTSATTSSEVLRELDATAAVG